MSARSFEYALWNCRQTLRGAIISRHARPSVQSKVSFSTTRTRRRSTGIHSTPINPKSYLPLLDGVPSFNTASSSELNDLLLQVRTKIFLPAYLRSSQRKLIYKDKHRSMLENDPVVVEIGSESFTLQHLDRTKDIPDLWKSFKRAIDLMDVGSSADWNNIIPLLQGFKATKQTWESWRYENVVRRAGEAGHANVIVDALQQVETTGLSLSNLRIAREAIWACRELALKDGWDQKSTEKALRLAQYISTLMEEESHRASKKAELDPRSAPEIIGVLLELTARLALGSSEPLVHLNNVKLYAERLLPNLERSLSQVPPTSKDTELLFDADYELTCWTPIWKALQLTITLLGDSMPQKAHAVDLVAKIKQDRLKPAETAIAEKAKTEYHAGLKGMRWSEAALAESHTS